MSPSVQRRRIRQKCLNEISIPLYEEDSNLINAQISILIQSPYLCIFDAHVGAIRCSPRPYLRHRSAQA